MTTPAAVNLFLSQGVRIQTGSNEPFWINDPQHTWFVEDGSVDLFVVPMAGGKPAGPRSHLLRVAAGQMIGGIERDGAAEEVAFLAVGGPQSQVYRLPVEQLSIASNVATP